MEQRALLAVRSSFWMYVICTAVLYGCCALLSVAFFVVKPEQIAIVWPGSGVFLAALLLNPRRAWPWLLAAVGLVNLLVNLQAQPVLVSLGLALANLSEGLLAAWILRVVLGPSIDMSSTRGLLGFTALAVVASNAVSALLGAAVVTLSFGTPFASAWIVWAVADGLGMLLIVPAALSWAVPFKSICAACSLKRITEFGLMLVILGFGSWFVFASSSLHDHLVLPYPLFPLLIWAALCFRMHGATLAVLLLATIAILATRAGLGPFVATGSNIAQHVLNVQLYLAVSALSCYTMAAVTTERGLALAALQHSHVTLEQQVAERTAALRAMNEKLSTEVDERSETEAELWQSRIDLEQQVARRTAELQQSNARLAEELRTRKVAEATLRESENRYRSVVEAISEGLVLQNADGQILTCNPAAERILGLSMDQMMGRTSIDPRWRAVREDDSPFPGHEHPAMRALSSGEAQHGVVMGVYTPDERLTWISINAEPLILHPGEQPYGVVASFFDLTAHKAAEAQIRAALLEKDVLLREIHHRVKNNLQVISSLLKLQASTASDQMVKALLLESQQRVRAMALVHEKLYQSRNMAQIDFASYVRSLSGALQRIYRLPGVQLHVAIENVTLGVDRTMTLGLMLNELISNSFKHAFPAGRTGQVCINVERRPEHGLVLTVTDDGVGLPSDFDPVRTTSMGFQVVTTLAAQLDAQLGWETLSGARLSFTIPERMLHD